MVTRRRQFDGAAPERAIVSSDDRVTPDERTARHLADVLRMPADALPRSGYAGVHPDDEASTDAVEAIEQLGELWQARWVLAEQDGSLVARSLLLEAAGRTTPPGGITANLLRELSPAAAIAAAAASVDGNDFLSVTARWARREVRSDGVAGVHNRKSGRPRLPEDELAAVALAYLEELRRGRGVLQRLAQRFDREPATMRDRVRQARDSEFLTRTTQGRRGGSAGPSLIAYLAEQSLADGEGHEDG